MKFWLAKNQRDEHAQTCRAGAAGVTVIELLMALGVLGIVVLFGSILTMRMTSSARAAQARANAESVLSLARNSLVRHFELRLPQALDSKVRSGLAPAFVAGEPFKHSGMQLTVTQKRERGFSSVNFATTCEKTPPALIAKLAKHRLANLKLAQILAADDQRSLASLCHTKAVVCPPGERPALRIARTVLDQNGRSVPKETLVSSYPPPNSRGDDVIAGGFCFVRSAALEYQVAFQQVVLDEGRVVYLKRDALLPLGNEEPYAAAAGITFVAPGE
jgi:hypothetical protein